MERSSKALIILPILSGIFWGSAGLFVRTLTDEGFSNGTMIFVRSFFGSIILFIAIFIYNRNLLKIKLKDLWLFLGTGGVGMLGVCITYNLSMLMQSLSVAVVLLSLSPVFVMIFAAILFKEEITSRKLICMAAAVLGIMMSGGLIGGSGNTITVSGLLMGLASALFYGLYTIFSRLASERGYHTYTILFYSVFITMIASLPFANLGTVGTYIAVAPFKHLMILILQAICMSVLPYAFYTIAVNKGDAGKVAIIGSVSEPSSAVVFGIVFYNEIPTPFIFAGLVITIAALCFLCIEPKKKPRRGDPEVS